MANRVTKGHTHNERRGPRTAEILLSSSFSFFSPFLPAGPSHIFRSLHLQGHGGMLVPRRQQRLHPVAFEERGGERRGVQPPPAARRGVVAILVGIVIDD
jgi:hypothetical protein